MLEVCRARISMHTHAHGCTPTHMQFGNDCPAVHLRLQWHRGYDLPGNPPAQGGREVPHRVLHQELLGDRSDPCCVRCDFLETDPIPAAYAAILFGRAKASGPARPYFS